MGADLAIQAARRDRSLRLVECQSGRKMDLRECIIGNNEVTARAIKLPDLPWYNHAVWRSMEEYTFLRV